MAFNTASCIVVLVLAFSMQTTKADSFMETWLVRQQSKLVQQVNLQMAAPNSFNGNDWLARQHGKNQADWLTNQIASQAESVDSFSGDAWLARQEASSQTAKQDGTYSQGAWAPAASWEADEDLEQGLLTDIEEALGKEHRRDMEVRIAAIEDSIRPMFKAMPKNEYDKLGHSSVRYMLHRVFVEQHGWFIEGLFAEGAALNTSSPSGMLKDRVPMFVQGLFEKRLGGRGFGIHELAVMVAVVEDSVNQEAQVQLKKTYKALGLDLDRTWDAQQMEVLVQVYMSGYIMGTNMSAITAEKLYEQQADMIQYYPTWNRAQEYFREVQKKHAGGKEILSFTDVSVIVKALVDTFGSFHGKQCQGLKSTLQDLEGKGAKTGCVGLPDFYKKGLKADSNWLFIESPDYLRQIGVLDETDPKNPRLLAANYINSPTNCMSPTGYYMVCCHNEGDDILGSLEKQLGQPTATPKEIIAALKTSSLRGGRVGRSLPPMLRHRLNQVAEHHGGRVPIHGRLFAQWLHHVYPYEVSYPHVSGSKHPQWVLDFEDDTGKSSQFSDKEMEAFVVNASKRQMLASNKTLVADAGSCAPWQDEEELFAPLPLPRSLALHEIENDPHVWNIARGIAFLGVASTFAISLMRTCKSVTKVTYQSKMLQI